MSDSIIEEHIEKFKNMRPTYEAFEQALKSLVVNLINCKKLSIVTIDSRTKNVDSFHGKITREGKSYTDPLTQITDLVGIRIVTYQLADIDSVSSLITENFFIDIENSVDKSQIIEADRFGYLSVHY